MQKLKKKGRGEGEEISMNIRRRGPSLCRSKKILLKSKVKKLYLYFEHLYYFFQKLKEKYSSNIQRYSVVYIYIYNWNKNFSALRRWKIIFALFFARIENIESSKRKKKKRIFRKNSLNLIGNRYFKGEKKILPFALMSRIRDKFITHERR